MADDRIIFKCRACGDTWALGKLGSTGWLLQDGFTDPEGAPHTFRGWWDEHTDAGHLVMTDAPEGVRGKPFAVHQEDGRRLPGGRHEEEDEEE